MNMLLKHDLSCICRWLGLDMSLEPDILQSLASTLQRFGLADVSSPVWNAPQGDLTAFKSWCSTVLPSAAPDSGGGAHLELDDAVSWAFGRPCRHDWVRSCAMVLLL
jgi:hypothetical protein